LHLIALVGAPCTGVEEVADRAATDRDQKHRGDNNRDGQNLHAEGSPLDQLVDDFYCLATRTCLCHVCPSFHGGSASAAACASRRVSGHRTAAQNAAKSNM